MTKKYQIAVLPGDGTGPEVVAEGIKALEASAEKYDFTFVDFVPALCTLWLNISFIYSFPG